MIELYINNTRCDVRRDAALPLRWQSNIFADITKIVGNKSASITLPYTPTNRMALALGELPATDGVRARRKLAARLIIDGVQIFDDGFAVLLASTAEGYEIALTWGVVTRYNMMVEDDTSLDEATWLRYTTGSGSGNVLMMHSPNPVTTELQTDWRYLTYYTEVGTGGDENVPPYLPSVLVKWLLDEIAWRYGVTLDIPAARRAYLDNLAVLLTSADIAGRDEVVSAVVGYNFDGDGMADVIIENERDIITPPNPLIAVTTDCTMQCHAQMMHTAPFYIEVLIYKDGGDGVPHTATSIYNDELHVYECTLEFENEMLGKGDQFFCNVYDIDQQPLAIVGNRFELGFTNVGHAAMGHYMHITPNLPRLTPIAFLKEMALIAGVFAVDAQGDTLRFVTAEQLMSDAPQVLPDPVSVERVSYTYGDMARRNEMVYKTDEGGDNDGKGVLLVDDETLDYSRVMLESYFGLLYDRTHLHLYERDEDDRGDSQAWKYRSDVTQRLAQIASTAAVDADLSFSVVLAQHLPTYAASLLHPVVVKCTIVMPLIDVTRIDLARSVYVPRLGRRYAVLAIDMTARDTFTFELIQLP